MIYYLFAYIHWVFYSVRVDLHRSGGYGGYGQQQQGGYGGYGQDQGGYGQQGGYGGGGRFIFFRFLRSVTDPFLLIRILFICYMERPENSSILFFFYFLPM